MLHDIGYTNTKNFHGGYLLFKGKVFTLLEFQIDADKKIASKEAVEAKNKEKEEIREKQEKEQKPPVASASEVIKASSKVVQFKKVGKIDLEPKKEITVEKTIPVKKEDAPKIAEKPVEDQEKTNTDSSKKDNYKKLTGLKATGEKIDLNQFKKPESDSSPTKSKKKRRRIVSNKGSAPQNNSGNSKFKPKARPSRTTKEEPSEEEVQRQIKETLEKLQGKSSKGKAEMTYPRRIPFYYPKHVHTFHHWNFIN